MVIYVWLIGTLGKKILKQHFGPLATQQPNVAVLVPFERLAMNVYIPELSLVAVTSQSGRVALITVGTVCRLKMQYSKTAARFGLYSFAVPCRMSH